MTGTTDARPDPGAASPEGPAGVNGAVPGVRTDVGGASAEPAGSGGPRPRGGGRARGLLRLVGIALLAVLLVRADLGELTLAVRQARWGWVAVAVAAMFPMLFLKTLRWQVILRAQGVEMAAGPAYRAYLASLFVGFLTPGRLGEFIRAVYVSRETGATSALGFSSVLADRLFDLYMLLLVGSVGAVTLAGTGAAGPELVLVIALLTIPLIVYLNDRSYSGVRTLVGRLGPWAARLLDEESWLDRMRSSLKQVRWPQAVHGTVLTVLAYGIFFGECYLLALALDLPVGFVPVMFAIAFGSLVTLLPISIAGLGAREVAVVTYLGTFGVAASRALVFSLLVFFVFFVLGGVFGAIAWWIEPVPLERPEG